MEYELVAPWETFEEVSTEYLYSRLRHKRNELLAESDWTQVLDAPIDRQAWAQYRQALRDAPDNWTPAPTWTVPTPPSS